MAVDASALVAVGLEELEAATLAAALSVATQAHVTPINYVEAGLILLGRGRFENQRAYCRWLSELDVNVSDLQLGCEALAAYLTYGKGRHPARLNLADCFAYALANALDAPLLYKGDDFARTDIRSALQPT